MTTHPPKRGRGRPKVAPQDKRAKLGVSLSPAEVARLLKQTGAETLTDAIRKLIR